MSLPFVFVMRLGIFRSSTCESDYTNALVVYIRGKTPLEGPHASLVIRLCHEDLRVSVHARNQPQADSPPDSFRHLALVDRSKACVLVVLDLAHLRNVFGHDAEVLFGFSSAFTLSISNLPISSRLPCTFRQLTL